MSVLWYLVASILVGAVSYYTTSYQYSRECKDRKRELDVTLKHIENISRMKLEVRLAKLELENN